MKTQIIVTAIVLFGACTEVRTQSESIYESELTPSSISKTESSIGSYSRSKSLNLVEKLFKEVIDSDDQLKTLVKKQEELSSSLRTKQSEILRYLELNRDYFSIATKIADDINSDENKNLTVKQLTEAKDAYHNKFEIKEKRKADALQHMEQELEDQLKMLKINISLKMISNYQKNELHSIDEIQAEFKKIEDRFKQLLAE